MNGSNARCCYEAAPGLQCPKRARTDGLCKRHAVERASAASVTRYFAEREVERRRQVELELPWYYY